MNDCAKCMSENVNDTQQLTISVHDRGQQTTPKNDVVGFELGDGWIDVHSKNGVTSEETKNQSLASAYLQNTGTYLAWSLFIYWTTVLLQDLKVTTAPAGLTALIILISKLSVRISLTFHNHL